MSSCFVFHVQTGEEHKACEFLNKLFDKEESVAFVPQVEIVIKNSQSTRKELRPMFPGYVFTDSIFDERVFVNLACKYARFSKCKRNPHAMRLVQKSFSYK
jgi:transcriptional antiterminator NusG